MSTFELEIENLSSKIVKMDCSYSSDRYYYMFVIYTNSIENPDTYKKYECHISCYIDCCEKFGFYYTLDQDDYQCERYEINDFTKPIEPLPDILNTFQGKTLDYIYIEEKVFTNEPDDYSGEMGVEFGMTDETYFHVVMHNAHNGYYPHDMYIVSYDISASLDNSTCTNEQYIANTCI